MIFNGEFMFIHANYKNSLYYLEKDDTLFVSTRPLSTESWKEFPINKLIGIKNGQIIYVGKKHDYDYTITEEHLNFILNHIEPNLKAHVMNNIGDLNYASEYQFNNK